MKWTKGEIRRCLAQCGFEKDPEYVNGVNSIYERYIKEEKECYLGNYYIESNLSSISLPYADPNLTIKAVEMAKFITKGEYPKSLL